MPGSWPHSPTKGQTIPITMPVPQIAVTTEEDFDPQRRNTEAGRPDIRPIDSTSRPIRTSAQRTTDSVIAMPHPRGDETSEYTGAKNETGQGLRAPVRKRTLSSSLPKQGRLVPAAPMVRRRSAESITAERSQREESTTATTFSGSVYTLVSGQADGVQERATVYNAYQDGSIEVSRCSYPCVLLMVISYKYRMTAAPALKRFATQNTLPLVAPSLWSRRTAVPLHHLIASTTHPVQSTP